jgi:hypothetical protein
MKTRRPRRVIRDYRASKQFTGYNETRTREMVADGTHPRAMKGARGASFFEDEIAGWQHQRATRGRAPPHLGPIYVFHEKVRGGPCTDARGGA